MPATNEEYFIFQFTANDILCGKSKAFRTHKGNVAFQDVISEHKHIYETATSKQERMELTRKIVRIMKHKYQARFLKPLNGDEWRELSETLARDKVSHALRHAVKPRCVSPKTLDSGAPASRSESLLMVQATMLATNNVDDEGECDPVFRRQQSILRKHLNLSLSTALNAIRDEEDEALDSKGPTSMLSRRWSESGKNQFDDSTPV